MKIIRADHLGMCFGVRDAIKLAISESRKQPLTILGDLVHNESVMAELRSRGIEVADKPEQLPSNGTVMITAHGAAGRAIDRIRAKGHEVLEATCPLVHVAHRAVKKLAAEGCHVVIIGKRDHVEVRGLTGDLDDFDVILSESEVYELPERARFGVAAQTTQPIDKVRRLVQALRQRFPNSEVHFVDTVCQPTKHRQQSASELARQSDVVVVIGGQHSNNTQELVQTCSRYCSRVHHVQSGGELRPEWFDGAQIVGITAGTSTPDGVIEDVEKTLQRMVKRLAGMDASQQE
jgi:4-hydroxy-3-methylbut-2-en-1-yl diphosphate reductase